MYGGCNELKAFVIRDGERLYEVTATSVSRSSPSVEGGLRARQVAVALAGWLSRRIDGMTDRIDVDAPEDWTDGEPVGRFARAPTELTDDLVSEFGPSIAKPRETPVIVVCEDGDTTCPGSVAAAETGRIAGER